MRACQDCVQVRHARHPGRREFRAWLTWRTLVGPAES